MSATPPEKRGAATARFAFVGFGALAYTLAAGLRAAGVDDVRVFVRPPPDAAAAAALLRRLEAAGVERRRTLDSAVRDADVVVAAVPAAAAREVVERCVPSLGAGSLYVDPAPLSPQAKRAANELVQAAGAAYVDAAVLGTVETSGFGVSIAAAGPGAAAFRELVVPLGMDVSVLEGPPGRATALKLLRSVYMKGRDALILEMLLAARRHGLEREVAESIGGAGEQVAFPELASRVMASLALYANRRAEELGASADLVAEVGVEPLVTSAGAERLRLLAQLDLRDRLRGERPQSFHDVLALVEQLTVEREL